ncbi:MAG: Flp family type IVb pilin [Chloroflexota bacterium]
MNKSKLRKRTKGQGLVEYALILALVAVVTIAGAWAMGQAIKRVFGVVGGALGKNNSVVGTFEIQSANCWVVTSPAPAKTGLVVLGFTTKPVTTLIGSTNKYVGTDVNGDPAPVTSNGGNTFIWQPYLSFTTANASLCPPSVVIQAKDGSTIFSPVTVQYSP